METKRVRSRRNLQILRKKLLEKYNYACALCGTRSEYVPLEIAHVVPVRRGGQDSEDNLIVLCPNCHRSFDLQPREIEFVSFLSELLRLHPDYADVQREVITGSETRLQADIVATQVRNRNQRQILIECKTPAALTSINVNQVIAQLNAYREHTRGFHIVLAIPATLTEQQLSALAKANVDTWDLKFLSNEFADQVEQLPISYYKALLLAHFGRSSKPTVEEKLLSDLAACPAGKSDWPRYQSLVGDILENLFTPPLAKPIPELSDEARVNRRDFTIPNYAEKGFWAFMRDKYKADYIVVDAKNNVGKVKKAAVLQIANYLKEHGAGLFGMIITRQGGDPSGCKHTLREQWLLHRKLIVVLDDEDIKAMLIAKSDGQPPENVIASKIEKFRLSM